MAVKNRRRKVWSGPIGGMYGGKPREDGRNAARYLAMMKATIEYWKTGTRVFDAIDAVPFIQRLRSKTSSGGSFVMEPIQFGGG